MVRRDQLGRTFAAHNWYFIPGQARAEGWPQQRSSKRALRQQFALRREDELTSKLLSELQVTKRADPGALLVEQSGANRVMSSIQVRQDIN
jgi:hypothetical protein